jgi:hypothetical protein
MHQKTATPDFEPKRFGGSVDPFLDWIPMMLIKLNDKGVRVYLATGGASYRRSRLDWQNRTGRIANYSRDRSHAYVVWNGTHSLDRVSVALIEPCSFAPDIPSVYAQSAG